MDEQQADPGSAAGVAPPPAEQTRAARPFPPAMARRTRLIAGGVALVVTGAAAGFALPHDSHAVRVIRQVELVSKTGALAASGAQITVTGSATVQGTPDTVSFTIGVHTVESTATAALADNNAEIVRLEHALETKGISAADLQTSSLDVYANTDSSGYVTGFSVDDDLNVTTHRVSDAGEAIDTAAGAVGNDISLYGISFSISNESALLATARGEAMANARTEAEQVAAGGGLSLGPIVKVVDQENTQSTNPVYAFGAAVPAATGALEIERGTQPVSVQVSVVYELQS
jgi:uncharacterized protein YggE